MIGGELIKVKMEESVAVITISRPSENKVNVLTAKVMEELNNTIDQLARDNAVNVIVITGEGPYTFVAGADIKEPIDLIIRTGKKRRLSARVPLSGEFAELYFMDIFFPDITAGDIQKALDDYFALKSSPAE